MAHEIYWEPRGVRIVFSGELNATDLLKATVSVHANHRYDDAHYLLIDYRSVTSFSFEQDVLDEIKGHRFGAHQSNPKVRIAFVTNDAALREWILGQNTDELPYGLKVFSEIEPAIQWCG